VGGLHHERFGIQIGRLITLPTSKLQGCRRQPKADSRSPVFGEHKQPLDFAAILFGAAPKFTEGDATNAQIFHHGHEDRAVIGFIGCREIDCFLLESIEPEAGVLAAAAEKVAIGEK